MGPESMNFLTEISNLVANTNNNVMKKYKISA